MRITKSKKVVITHAAQPCHYPPPTLGAKFNVMVWLWLATKGPSGRPSPHWGAEDNRKKQAKTGRSGQGQFHRTANKGNRNNNDTDKENTQNKTKQNSRTQRELLSLPATAARSRAATDLPPLSSPQLEPSMTAYGMEYPVLFGQVGSASPAMFLPGFW